MPKATVYIISAPSGCGKTSLVRALLATMNNVALSISHTTRPPRPTEVSGDHYHFTSIEVFKDMIQKNAFVEYAKVFEHYYGTALDWIENKLHSNTDVITEVDLQGAEQIKTKYEKAISIFIRPPSIQILRERLLKRGENSHNVAHRLQKAPIEIERSKEYDYLIVNTEFEKAVSDLKAIIESHRLRTHD